MIKSLGPDIEYFAFGKYLWFHDSFCRAATYATQGIVFGFPEFKDCACGFLFDYQKWENCLKDSTCQGIGRLPTEKRTAEMRACLFVIIISTEIIAKKLDCSLIDHSDLNSFMIDRAHTIFPMCSLDSNISFTVDQTSEIGNRRSLHRSNHTTPPEMWSSKKGEMVV